MQIPTMLLVGLAVLRAPALCAQYATPYGPVPGSEVRVTSGDSARRVYTGRLRAFAGDSLVMEVGQGGVAMRLPVGGIRSVEVNDGPDRPAAALKYGGIGFLAGGVLGTAMGSNPLERFVGALVGMPVGLVAGAITGMVAAPDQWRTVWP